MSIIVIVFAPLGIALLFAAFHVQELIVDYSHCGTDAGASLAEIPDKYVSLHFKSSLPASYSPPQWKTGTVGDRQMCHIVFSLPNDLQPPVFLYYKLTNFYQNQRNYVKSYDWGQLQGKPVPAHALSSDCSPVKTNKEGKAYYPCGLIANSYFNDTFSSPVLLNPPDSSANNITYELTEKGISWTSDASRFGKTRYNASEIVPPPNWAEMFPDGYTEENLPDLKEWESLQNWMRTAGLPSFYKLAKKNTTETMAQGTYQIDIELNYPTSIFGGTKSIVLSTNSVIGGRNIGLGVCYLVIAGVAVALAIFFLVKHLITPRKLGDHSYLNFGSPES